MDWYVVGGIAAAYVGYRYLTKARSSSGDAMLPKQDVQSAIQDAEAVLQRYGAVLEAFGSSRDIVWDVSKLPLPKDNLKKLIKACLGLNDDSIHCTLLRLGYTQLACFQEGVGPAGGRSRLNAYVTMSIEQLSANTKYIAADAEHDSHWGSVVLAESLELLKEVSPK